MIDFTIKYTPSYIDVGGMLGLPVIKYGEEVTLKEIQAKFPAITDDEITRLFDEIGETVAIARHLTNALNFQGREVTDYVYTAMSRLAPPKDADASVTLAYRIARDELKYIYEGNWVYLAHESQLPNVNDFLTVYIGRQPVVVTRSKDGQIEGVKYDRLTALLAGAVQQLNVELEQQKE